MIPNHYNTLQQLRVCIDFNAAIIKEITNFCSGMFENKKYHQVSQDLLLHEHHGYLTWYRYIVWYIYIIYLLTRWSPVRCSPDGLSSLVH